MKLAYIYLVGASHPPLEGGAITGHGGAALCPYAGLTQQQAVQFETMGQVEAPIGRSGQAYWALKTTGAAAAQSVVNSHPGMEPADVVLKPVTVTHVGLLRLVRTGHLYCVDAHHHSSRVQDIRT